VWLTSRTNRFARRKQSPWWLFDKRLGGLKKDLNILEKNKNLFHLLELERCVF
jgi:hypothetical protein